MHSETWKVGEIAKLTQLSVRTLHYYDEVGLLKPTARSGAGHRLYTEDDVVRLQRIVSLRQLGFSLDDIRGSLESPDYALAPVLDLHLARLTEQIARQQRLHQQLSALRERLSSGTVIPVSQFLKTLEAITMIDTYLTPEQIQVLESRREQYRATHGAEAAQGFKTFVEALRVHQKAGTDPASAAVQALASEQSTARRTLTSDEQAMADALSKMLHEDPALRQRYELDDALLAYLDKVMAINHA